MKTALRCLATLRLTSMIMLISASFSALAAPVTLTVVASGNGSVQSSPAGINCPGTCNFDFASGTDITLTAAPSAGSALGSWALCDTGFGLTCAVTAIALPSTVTATFATSAAVAPDAPTIGTAVPGNGMATLNFAAPASNGGAAITNFNASCTPGPVTTVGLASPIVVRGLANATAYTCTVSATNAAGTGPTSGTVMVTPNVVPLALVAVRSRKTHGSSGTYDVPVNTAVGLGGAISVEPRNIGTGHSLIFEFNGPVNTTGTVSAVDSSGAPVTALIGSATVPSPGTGALITMCCGVNVLLPDAADGKRVNVTLTGVNGTFNTSAPIGLLLGDANSTGIVNAADISAVKARTGQTTNTTNFRTDLNISGGIDSGDVALAKSRTGRSLAPVLSPPTVSICYAQSGKINITGTNFIAGVTSLTINGLAANVGTVTATTLVADLPGGVAEGVAPVIVTVSGAPSAANASCNVAITTPIVYSVEGSVIPAPFSKFANTVPAPHPGLNGGNGNPGYYYQNAWAVSPAGVCNNATPGITRIWYHNLNFAGYLNGAGGSEYFGVGPNQALVYSFIAPPEGTSGSLTTNESTVANFVASFVSISTAPCDFDPTRVGVGLSSPYVGCYNMRNGISNTSYYSTSGPSLNIFACKLIPGQRYYLNYRSLDSTIPPTDSCQAIGAANCGGLLTMH